MYNPLFNPLTSGYFGTKRPRVIGHRGASGTCPENTLVSFQQAVADGADILEMDVHLTLDGKVVVIHDATVDRTTSGTGQVGLMLLDTVQSLDAGYHFTTDGGKTFPFRGKGVTVPTFAEVLEAFPKVPMNVEIKGNDPALVHNFFQLLREHNRLKDIMVLVAAEPTSLMSTIRSAEPKATTGHSYWEVVRFLTLTRLRLPWLFTPQAPAMQVPNRTHKLDVVTPNFVRYAHMLGMEVHVWTINEEAEMKRLLAMGVDGLFTDFPGRMRQLVDSGKWKAKPGGT